MKVITMTRAKITNTPEIISLRKRLSNFICMNCVITVATFILAMIRAMATAKAPRWYEVTATESVVRSNSITSTVASEEKLEICGL